MIPARPRGYACLVAIAAFAAFAALAGAGCDSTSERGRAGGGGADATGAPDGAATATDGASDGEDAAARDALEPGADGGVAEDAEPGRDAEAPGDATPERDAGAGPDASGTPDGGAAGRPLGTVSGVTSGVPCGGSGAAAGAECTRMTVHCPGIPDITGFVAVSRVPTARGTITVHSGAGGMDYYSTNVPQFLSSGFNVVQVRWETQWEDTGQGILPAACRVATIVQWVFDNIHGASRTEAFCATGHSGGSGAISYMLAHYDMGRLYDYASLSAGPPFGRIDWGCAPQLYMGPRVSLCPELLDAPFDLPMGMNQWESTTTCRSQNPLPADLAKWRMDSVVSPGASYDYPQTVVDFYNCTNMPNGTAGGAFFYSSEITSAKNVVCFTAQDGCAFEGVGNGGNVVMLTNMIARCIPRH